MPRSKLDDRSARPRADAAQYPASQIRRWFDRQSLVKSDDSLGKVIHQRGALCAFEEVGLVPASLLGLQCSQNVGGSEVFELAHEVAPNACRSRSRPSRIRVLTVPRGRSSIRATSG